MTKKWFLGKHAIGFKDLPKREKIRRVVKYKSTSTKH